MRSRREERFAVARGFATGPAAAGFRRARRRRIRRPGTGRRRMRAQAGRFAAAQAAADPQAVTARTRRRLNCGTKWLLGGWLVNSRAGPRFSLLTGGRCTGHGTLSCKPPSRSQPYDDLTCRARGRAHICPVPSALLAHGLGRRDDYFSLSPHGALVAACCASRQCSVTVLPGVLRPPARHHPLTTSSVYAAACRGALAATP
jgi:hypothetical protein